VRSTIDSLSARERQVYDGFKADKRRIEWLAGRTLAKQLVRDYLDVHGPEGSRAGLVEILPSRGGAPVVWLTPEGKTEAALLDVCLSISHRSPVPPAEGISPEDGLAGAALAESPSRIGIDIELVEERHPSFVRSYFCLEERKWVGCDPFRITLGWAAKEAALKALRTGLAANPADIEVLQPPSFGPGWTTLDVRTRLTALDSVSAGNTAPASLSSRFLPCGPYVVVISLIHGPAAPPPA